MANPSDSGYTDPRDLGGDISGPGGPHDKGGVVVDARRALIVDYQEVVQIDNPSDGRQAVGLLLKGRINQSPDRASVLCLGTLDFSAALITECFGLAQRMGQLDELERLCDERWKAMP